MKCEAVTRQLPFLAYGELSFDEEEQLQQHLNGCPLCGEEYRRFKSMCEALDRAEPDPDPKLLIDCRRNLRLGVAALAEAGAARSYRPRLWFSRLLGSVALIAIGFFSARFVPTASHVRSVQPGRSGQLQVVVEETRQRVLSGDMGDEPIRRLLLEAARESSDPYLRVEMMDVLKSHPHNPDVRSALLYASQNDPVAGVRLKALEGLRSLASDPETRRVVARVLLTDTDPAVRTQAVDLLAQNREPALAGVLQELMTREDNNHVRLKSQKALHAMNASVDTF